MVPASSLLLRVATGLLLIPLLALFVQPAIAQLQAHPPCQPVYVRWPRVRLNNQAVARTAPLALNACRNACSEGQDQPSGRQKASALQCSAFNHRPGVGSQTHDCQLFRREHVQHTDGYVEADDRYTFYWKYCVDTDKSCTGEYAFTFLSDRYMLASEVRRTKFTRSLEDCLGECLNGADGAMLCRSVSFNRTDGGCHLSEQNQLSKPSAIRVNNNPNFRVDYYENNCFNNSFTFTSICEPTGVRIRVSSRIPYTGALYGLYDFFSCRTEPKEAKQFEYLFPYPHLAKNCSDSMRQSGQELLLEVVLSTDGVEPLYFITADDLTYQAKCPLPHQADYSSPSSSSSSPSPPSGSSSSLQLIGDELGDLAKLPSKEGASVHSILEALGAAAQGPSLRRRFEMDERNTAQGTTAAGGAPRSMEMAPGDGDDDDDLLPSSSSSSSSSAPSPPPPADQLSDNKLKPFTKDMFTLLPLYTPDETTTASSSSSSKVQQSPTSSVNALKTTSNSSQRTTGSSSSASVRIGSGRKIGMEPIFDGMSRGHEEEEEEPSTAVTFLTQQRTMPPATISTTSETFKQTTPTVIPSTTTISVPVSSTTQTSSTTSTSSATTPTTSSSSTMTTSMTTAVGASRGLPEESGSSTSLAVVEERVKTTTKRAVGARMDEWGEAARSPAAERDFSFSTHLVFPPDRIWMSTGSEQQRGGREPEVTSAAPSSSSSNSSSSSTTIMTNASSTMTTIPTTMMVTTGTTPAATSTVPKMTMMATHNESGGHPPGTPPFGDRPGGGGPGRVGGSPRQRQQEKVIFDVFHNGQPTEAVVVGSRITLAFTPYFAIPPAYMSISGCQVEPIGSLYEWEKEPLAIIKDGCQADHVGLVCPPQKTDYGIRVTVEAFRYQTTTQVQYTCLVRVCPFAPCPQTTCPAVEGCPGDDIVSRTLGLYHRAKRDGGGALELSLEQIRSALATNPQLQRQLTLAAAGDPNQTPASPPGGPNPPMPQQRPHRPLMADAPLVGGGHPAAPRMNTALQQQLIMLGGDTLVRRRLVVVNSEEELRYYIKTGEVPQAAGA